MALRTYPSSARGLLELIQPPCRRATGITSNPFCRINSSPSPRHVSTAAPQRSEMEVDKEARPRWSHTPPAMAAPVRSRPPRRETPWKVNDNPLLLDSFYIRFLGPGGEKMLSEDTKWLAITHKSFDHGRRGFNDRLSYIGKRIVELQMTLALLGSSTKEVFKVPKDPHGREPFQHPAIDGIEVLNGGARAHLLHHTRISGMSQQYGLQHVVRWNPRKPESLQASGLELVLTQAVFAIVGAIALERGGGEANHIVRERIIAPLGVRSQVIEGSGMAKIQ